ncbi:restriction endonuclease subunit S [Vibrio agarivorans]|uniref:restriction endonuclease subunit S n=1 Tax=Vibrio agarivorans TaxID=153622 RepID=UPI0025B46DB4|nr:restriction endonuclease subunit S [Vibrio agarivorans]MDN3660436.1 restriction endonuclease subunit S [Vibrio agarivorans]
MTDKQTVKFGDICKEVKLTTKDPIGDGYERYIGLEHLDSGSLKIKRWGMIADDSPSFTRVFKKGQILFGKRRPYLKKAAIAEFDGICSSDIIVLEPTSNLPYPRLLPFLVQSDGFWDWAVKTSSGSLSPRTKYKDLAEYRLKLGDEKSQRVMLKVLDDIESYQDLIDGELKAANELRGAIELDLLGSLVSYQIAAKKGYTPLSKLGEFKNGINKGKESFGRGNNFVNLDDVFAADVLSEAPKGLVECSESELTSYSMTKGDILFVRSSVKPSGVAKTTLITNNLDKTVYSGFLIRFRPHNSEYSEFLNFLFNSKVFKHRISAFVTVSANSNINQKSLEIQQIMLPSVARAKEISSLLRSASSVIDILNEKLNSIRKVQKSILNS